MAVLQWRPHLFVFRVFVSIAGCAAQVRKSASLTRNDDVVVKVGMSCGLTGDYAVVCKDLQDGLLLLEDFLLDNSPFRTPTGIPIHMELTMRNDMSSPETARQHYQLFAQEPYDVLLGPYSSALSREAANKTSVAGRVLMLHNAAAPYVYDPGYEHTFSTDVTGDGYMQEGVELLWEQGAKTIYAALEMENGSFARSTCWAGLQHAKDVGFEVLGYTSLTSVHVARDLTVLTSAEAKSSHNGLRPDVLLACGEHVAMVNLAVTLRALGVSPKALLMLQATSNSFVQAVGAPNANYVFGPVSWSADYRFHSPCPVFDTPTNFAEKYRLKYAKEPTYHVASVVGAAIAILGAVQNASVKSNETFFEPVAGDFIINQTVLEDELRALDLQTFYERIRFRSDGLIEDLRCRTLQMKPLPTTRSRYDRYNQSQRTLVLPANGTGFAVEPGDHQAVYPMPNWLRKELEVYPCDDGSEIDPTVANGVACRLCPVGKLRDSTMVFCRACPANMYAVGEGNAECTLCPTGADCSHGAVYVDGLPLSAPGYYALPGRPPVFPACDPPENCIGGNQCRGMSSGVLCDRCTDGYIKDADVPSADCLACKSGALVVFLFFLAAIGYTVIVGALSYLSGQSAVCIRSLHSIILKIFSGYVVFTTSALEAGEYKLPQVIDVFVALGHRPFHSVMYMDCVFSGLGARPVYARVVLGLILIPMVLSITVCSWFLATWIRVHRFHLALETQHRPEIDGGPDGIAGEESEQPDEFFSSRHHADITARLRWLGLQETAARCTRWLVIYTFVLYPLVVRMLLEPLACTLLDEYRLHSDLDIECFSDSHLEWVRYSVIGIVFYGLGIPAAFCAILYKIHGSIGHRLIRQAFSFLFNGFETRYYYFETLYMLRKFAILLCTLFPLKYVRLLSMLLLSFVYMAIHARCAPYDDRDFFLLDRLEFTSMFSSIVLLGTSFLISVRDGLLQTDTPWTFYLTQTMWFDNLLYGVCALTHGYFFGLVIVSLVRNLALEDAELKWHVLKDKVWWWEWLVLGLERHGNKVAFDFKTHKFNIFGLNRREKDYFTHVVGSMLECYMMSGVPFHPGRLVTALREAMSLSLKSARTRAALLHRQALDKQSLRRSRQKVAGLRSFAAAVAEQWAEIAQVQYPSKDEKKKEDNSLLVNQSEADRTPTGEETATQSNQAKQANQDNQDKDSKNGCLGFASKLRSRDRSRKKVGAKTDNSTTVEELQRTLMMVELDIREQRSLFYIIEKAPETEKAEEGEDDEKDNVDNMLGGDNIPRQKVSLDDSFEFDTVSGKSPDEIVCDLVSSTAWGVEVDGKWQLRLDSLSSNRPPPQRFGDPPILSYAEWLEVKHPGENREEDRTKLKALFTEKDQPGFLLNGTANRVLKEYKVALVLKSSVNNLDMDVEKMQRRYGRLETEHHEMEIEVETLRNELAELEAHEGREPPLTEDTDIHPESGAVERQDTSDVTTSLSNGNGSSMVTKLVKLSVVQEEPAPIDVLSPRNSCEFPEPAPQPRPAVRAAPHTDVAKESGLLALPAQIGASSSSSVAPTNAQAGDSREGAASERPTQCMTNSSSSASGAYPGAGRPFPLPDALPVDALQQPNGSQVGSTQMSPAPSSRVLSSERQVRPDLAVEQWKEQYVPPGGDCDEQLAMAAQRTANAIRGHYLQSALTSTVPGGWAPASHQYLGKAVGFQQVDSLKTVMSASSR